MLHIRFIPYTPYQKKIITLNVLYHSLLFNNPKQKIQPFQVGFFYLNNAHHLFQKRFLRNKQARDLR